MRFRAVFSFIIAALLISAVGFYGDSLAQVKTAAKKNVTKADDFWTTDWDKAMATAKAEKKPMIIDFYTDWCRWCKKLDKETYAAPEIQKRLKEGWVGVKVNPEDKKKKGTLNGKVVSYADIARSFNVDGYPTLVSLDKEGNRVGDTNFEPRQRFGPILDYIKNELYKKKIPFENYLKDSMRK